MIVLGIETSCDETGVALYDGARGLRAESLHSQIALHAAYGGVVPELASRDHIRLLVPLIERTLNEAQADLADLDAIAYTAGPGLAGALLVGASVASALARSQHLPAYPVHHLEGHLLSPFLASDPPSFPFVALLVSGGHSQFMAVEGLGRYRLLGETVDDAVGEAFDKTAQLLGLPYPGGPALSQLARQGDPERFHLPRPLLQSGDLQLSFSGLKTAVAQRVRRQSPADYPDIAAAFEAAVVDVLTHKTRLALRMTGYTQLVVAGGVGANQPLRQALRAQLEPAGIRVTFPPAHLCTDNGAMIAYAGYCHLQNPALWTRYRDSLSPGFTIHPRWDLAAYATHL
ncbi:tRNA (adenosine(37)-N6)-threonylcarbamoyltransferase complex transferase subunit TsaD [Ferrovum myxofaciens]|jgi:N6-L-threonylcarbamoyladenine synthase|uniref:tRNA N6-adenosine threonylcarbamoyltransferase n=3 Tax=root TaxID=1 RepID=A0A8F3IF27_9PROT|nr:tRNA (adenosine(37)-N6)-threonylcarbamoyltransferase complex transferase subunit TsaD [Ferrovum myxofaciens]NDU90428.1 tRNA (adenosine(37)-N6)-threonylcarbamoyltransferase complex transferase subunit TsaD [Ferrovum sp.]KXW59050.1 tRNA N6-adenosine threonylcarbamoyltransferase [Ferrovum myxofaciens]MBU6995799.1 tRNA (adenosine(37)-N6)-threonylcarbamoyltransferase complex transferase subunit TsaD [Ferrovum myxofaciens]QKE39417.1 MAG: tRNA (adenosine(37)-N6)-threonylcarbamoyltransferase complex